MSDIVILCKRDPGVLAGEPYCSCPIAFVKVDGGKVLLSSRPFTVELVFEYAELIARTFDGTIVSGTEIVEPTESMPLDLASLEAEWRDLDEAIAMDIEATLAVATRQRIAWEALRFPDDKTTTF